MDGVAGQHGWRWILIIEGLPTVVLGIAIWFLLADDPEHARYLTPEEKALMIVRRERQTGGTASAEYFTWVDAKKALRDWKVWAFATGQFGADTMLYGYSTFLPTIISDLGDWTAAEIQALTIPCYCLGAVTYLIVARISDSQQKRGLYAVMFGAISVIGYGLLISSTPSGVHYFGCFLVAMGLYVVVGLPLAWLPSNAPRYGKRTTASGTQLTIGNSSGIMAPFLYKTVEGPRYVKGHSVTLAMVGYASVLYGFLWWYHARINKKRKAGEEDWKIEGKSAEEVAELGDESPLFVYTI
ncbi:MAG: hypothetical protein M1833_002382 [Piccolia ochrophora]|nr:MAG: hypothetical protein M1833_002382 [Piccolia ochrophora]